MQPILEKIGVDRMETSLKNMFENDILVKEIQRRKCMTSLHAVIVNPTELDILRPVSKRGQHSLESHFTY